MCAHVSTTIRFVVFFVLIQIIVIIIRLFWMFWTQLCVCVCVCLHMRSFVQLVLVAFYCFALFISFSHKMQWSIFLVTGVGPVCWLLISQRNKKKLFSLVSCCLFVFKAKKKTDETLVSWQTRTFKSMVVYLILISIIIWIVLSCTFEQNQKKKNVFRNNNKFNSLFLFSIRLVL